MSTPTESLSGNPTSARIAARLPEITTGLLALAVVAAMVGGSPAKLGVGLTLGVAAVAATRLLRAAWIDRRTAGIAVLLLVVPVAVVWVSAGDEPGRVSLRLLLDDAVGVACGTLLVAAAVLAFSGTRTLAIARRSDAETPWRTFVTDGETSRFGLREGASRVLAGVLLVAAALLLGGVFLPVTQRVDVSWSALLLLTVLAFAAVVVAPGLAAVALIGRRDRAER